MRLNRNEALSFIDFYKFSITVIRIMPHINIKLYPGRSDELKSKLADKITEAVVEVMDLKEKTISVAIQEIPGERWPKEVYKREILGNEEILYKKPEYGYSDEELNSCTSLDEVRDNSDRIDQEIVKLIAERSFLVKEASRFKKDENDVEAPKRVEAVIEKVRKLADENKVKADIIEGVYRTMISSFISFEKDEFNKNKE